VAVAIGDFGGEFSNTDVPDEVAVGLRRQFVCHFAYFPHIRHLICDADNVVPHMEWAGYRLLNREPEKLVFKRDSKVPIHRGPSTSQ